MKKLEQAFSCFLAISIACCSLLLFSCSGLSPTETLPPSIPKDDKGATPPIVILSPPVLDATGTLVQGQFIVKGAVTRPLGQSVVGIVVTVRNVSQQNEAQIVVNADGSFTQGIAGVPGELVRVVAVDPVNQQQSNTVEAIIPYSGEVEFKSTVDLNGDGIPDVMAMSEAQKNAVLQVILNYLLQP